MVLFSVTGGEQNDLVLFEFQENKRLLGKMFFLLLVYVVKSTYAKLAHLDFVF